MRAAFINQLTVEARRRPGVFLVVGDVGYSVVEPFAAEFPSQFLNAGIAEQNTACVCAGLAAEGYHVFFYSTANFPTLRCFEQVRNTICYHGLPVTIVTVGAGVAYGNLGYGHHGVQDIAAMRSLPGITLLSPGDPGETTECVEWLCANARPSYLRLGKGGEPVLHDLRGIERGLLLVRQPASLRCDVALVSTGGILGEVMSAATLLERDGLAVAVYSMPWLKPMEPWQLRALVGYKTIVSVEEHVAQGGLAAALREVLPTSSRVLSICLPENIHSLVGSQAFLRQSAGLDAASIVRWCHINLK